MLWLRPVFIVATIVSLIPVPAAGQAPSARRWEGDTLVIDVTNVNEDTWIDSHGTFHSDALHVVERWAIEF